MHASAITITTRQHASRSGTLRPLLRLSRRSISRCTRIRMLQPWAGLKTTIQSSTTAIAGTTSIMLRLRAPTKSSSPTGTSTLSQCVPCVNQSRARTSSFRANTSAFVGPACARTASANLASHAIGHSAHSAAELSNVFSRTMDESDRFIGTGSPRSDPDFLLALKSDLSLLELTCDNHRTSRVTHPGALQWRAQCADSTIWRLWSHRSRTTLHRRTKKAPPFRDARSKRHSAQIGAWQTELSKIIRGGRCRNRTCFVCCPTRSWDRLP